VTRLAPRYRGTCELFVTEPPADGALGSRPSGADAFRNPSYRRLWASGGFVYAARWVDLVALSWLALELTGSPFMVGLAAFARTAPMMVVGPFAGIVADQISPGRVLVLTQAGGVATALALALLFGSGAGSYWPFVSLEVVIGVLWALDFSARRTSIYAVLGPSRVAHAMSLESASMQVAKMGGPLLAGLCLARLGPAATFTLLAALYAGGLAVSSGLRHSIVRPVVHGPVSVVDSLRAGLRAAWTHPMIRAVLLGTVAMNILVFPYQHMLSVFARDVLAGEPGVLGALIAAEGLGALVGALAIAAQRSHLPQGRLFGISIVVTPAIVVAFSLSPSLSLCLVLLVVLGLVEAAFAATQSTVVLLSAPERVRGGTVGILSACIGTQPLGTLAIGALVGIAGVSLAFAINALAALAVTLPLAAWLFRR
jgi:MFS family permease